MNPLPKPHLLRTQTVRYLSSVKNPRLSRPTGPALGLEHFLQRSRVLGLWREVVRAINRIPDEATRKDMRRWARGEFERNQKVTDITQIRYLISTGKTQLDNMKGYIEGEGEKNHTAKPDKRERKG